MEKRNRDLYIQWTQSPRIKAFIGTETKGFLFASELLRLRSPLFQEKIDKQAWGENTPILHLPDVDIPTFENFYLWSLSETPSIPERLSQQEVENLAFFADRYQVFALQHQAVTVLHENFDSGSWRVQPDIAARVYQECHEQSCLRLVFCSALAKLSPERFSQEMSEWSKLLDCGGQLAVDLFKAIVHVQASRQNRYINYRSMSRDDAACQFHDHTRHMNLERSDISFGSTQCPYQQSGSFSAVIMPEGPTEILQSISSDPSSVRVKSKKPKKAKKEQRLLKERSKEPKREELEKEPPLIVDHTYRMADESLFPAKPERVREEPPIGDVPMAPEIDFTAPDLLKIIDDEPLNEDLATEGAIEDWFDNEATREAVDDNITAASGDSVPNDPMTEMEPYDCVAEYDGDQWVQENIEQAIES